MPAGHLEHLEAPAVLKVPAGQVVHSVALDELNLPSAHWEHEPLDVLYLPAGQEAPSLPPPEEDPVHASLLVDAAGAVLPWGQHEAEALELLYLPFGQASHEVAPALLYLPMLHEAHEPLEVFQ